MYIPFKIIKELWDKESELKKAGIELDATDTQNAQIFRIDENKNISVNLLLTDEYITKLEEQKVNNISIYYNRILAKKLRKYYPELYPTPETEPLYKIKNLFLQFDLANTLSSYENKSFKSRKIKLLQDIIISPAGSKKIITYYGELISKGILEKLEGTIKESTPIEYTTNEKGIFLVFDSEAYKEDPQLLRLQYMVRKIFTDVNYKNLKASNVDKSFKEYFLPPKEEYYKLVILIGKTDRNINLYKMLKIFDPFSKTLWLTKDDLTKEPNTLFDEIINKLHQNYANEYKLFTRDNEDKTQLSQSQIQKYRQILTNFSKKFSLKAYIEIAYDIQQKSKNYNVFQPKTHLLNILSDLRATPDKIYERLLLS